MRYQYYNCCVHWPPSDVYAEGGLCNMIDGGRHVTRRTFQRNVGTATLREFESMMGYPFGRLTMARDYAVSYSSGKLHGQRAYWVKHSAIEYVFVQQEA